MVFFNNNEIYLIFKFINKNFSKKINEIINYNSFIKEFKLCHK